MAKIVPPVLVLTGAGVLAAYMIETEPRVERVQRDRLARLVEVVEVERTPYRIQIEAHGTVRAAREVTLRSQVGGEVIEVSDRLVPGGRLAKGDLIVAIDPRDYELAVRQRESDLAKVRAELALEQGSQTIAQREFELLGENLTGQEKSLVLRQPQLATAKANVAAAEAALAEARLALERTRILAPFDALVLSESVDVGSRLSTQNDIAVLVGTGVYWVELAVPVSKLKWIDLPDASGSGGSTVRLMQDTVWGSADFREGKVINLLGDLGVSGRMAQLLVAVEDP